MTEGSGKEARSGEPGGRGKCPHRKLLPVKDTQERLAAVPKAGR